jgi:integrase
VVGAATKQRIRATLRAALNEAIRERRIDLKVASLVELETGKRPKALVWTPERIIEWRTSRDRYVAVMAGRLSVLAHTGDTKYKTTRVKAINSYVGAARPSPVMVWTPEQTARFLDHIRGHRLYAQYHLIAFRGLRRGESCGLRWSDLNLQEATVAVRWQIVQIGYDTEQGRPKSEAGERQISLDKRTIAELKAHKTRQNTERLTAGENWNDSGLVFTTETGEPLHPAQVSAEFLRLAMAAGLPPVRLHDLRHGAATILLRAGYDMKVVQETFGLSSITIAADTYTSVLPDLARQSAEDAAAIILNAVKKSRRPTVRPAPPTPIGSALSEEIDGGDSVEAVS